MGGWRATRGDGVRRQGQSNKERGEQDRLVLGRGGACRCAGRGGEGGLSALSARGQGNELGGGSAWCRHGLGHVWGITTLQLPVQGKEGQVMATKGGSCPFAARLPWQLMNSYSFVLVGGMVAWWLADRQWTGRRGHRAVPWRRVAWPRRAVVGRQAGAGIGLGYATPPHSEVHL